MSPVPGVSHDWIREPLFGEPGPDPLRMCECCSVLLIGRRNPARPDRVQVDREPPPAKNISIARARVLPAQVHLHPVRSPGKEGRVDLIQRDIDPCDVLQRVKVFRLLGQRHGIIEIPAVDRVVGQGPELHDPTVREEGCESPRNLARHTGPSW